jgi:hypothetical protein
MKSIALFLICCLCGVFQVHSQGISVNATGASPDPSAMLDVSSSQSGFLLPRMSEPERDAIASPAQGLLLFNTTANCLQIFLPPSWQNIYCGCNSPAQPTAGTHTAGTSQITWNWNAVSGAVGYAWNTVNDYGTSTDVGNTTSYVQSGLAGNTPYSLYVWAYNSCGQSAAALLTQSTQNFTCGTSTVSFTYNGNPVTYGTVAGQNGSCWMDRNLGASQVATSYVDPAALGDLFQWGRGADGHHLRGVSVGSTATLSSQDSPGHPDFILTSADPNDWRSPQNNALWQGVSGTNNPCPAGWRLPTETEINNERMSWSQNNYTGAFASPLRWTAGGLRRRNTANIDEVGNFGIYWTSSPSGTFARGLTYFSTGAVINNNSRADAHSVRCVRN